MISLEVREAKNLKEKIIGLMMEIKAKPLLIKTRFGIHTFFLKFPIDILILDKGYKVRCVKEDLYPYRFFFWNPKYNMVVELPDGTIKENKIKTGQQVKLLTI
ncbi:MAG: DUF192 domain-containing protein [Patescibacteria group bacterium]|nr:DUF192 domain-containing protein [Patescibacteria group bacterium]